MDRFSVDDSGKKLIYQEALEFMGEARAGMSWERFSLQAVRHSDAFIDMLSDTTDVVKFLSEKAITREYLHKHIKDVLYRLHFNKGNDHYLTLSLPHSASEAQINRRWKDLMLIYHPDRNDDEDAAQCAKKINEAYNVLKSADKKRDYDTKMSTAGNAYLGNHPKGVLHPQRSRRYPIISPKISSLIPKLIIPCSIVTSLIILLTIFLNNKPAPSLSQTIVPHKKESLDRATADRATIPKESESEGKATVTTPSPEFREFYRAESDPPPRYEQAQRKREVVAVNPQAVKPSGPRDSSEGSDKMKLPTTVLFEENPLQKMEITSAGSTALAKAPDRISEKDQDDKQLQKKPEPIRDNGARGQASSVGQDTLSLNGKYGELETEVFLFLVQYVHAYEEGNISKFMGFFSKSAVENNTLRYDDIRQAYKKNFEISKYNYKLTYVHIEKKEGMIVAGGDYIIKKVLADEGTAINGKVRWTLSRENGKLKIIRIDHDKQ